MRTASVTDHIVANPIVMTAVLAAFGWTFYAWTQGEGPWLLMLAPAYAMLRINEARTRIASDRAFDEAKKQGRLSGTGQARQTAPSLVGLFGHPVAVLLAAVLYSLALFTYAALDPAERAAAQPGLAVLTVIMVLVLSLSVLRLLRPRKARVVRPKLTVEQFARDITVTCPQPAQGAVPDLHTAFARLPPALRELTRRNRVIELTATSSEIIPR